MSKHDPRPTRAREPRHGTKNGYIQDECRCRRCTNAWATYVRNRLAIRRARLAAGKPLPDYVVHGRCSTYTNWGCRCPKCSAAQTAYRRARYQRDRAEGFA